MAQFWEFTSGLLLNEIDWALTTSILGCRYHRASNLLALSCDDPSIRVVDVETRKLVRELWGPSEQFTDLVSGPVRRRKIC